ncbi:MAG: mechanosensitive ion channel [Rickettsiales bacterium]|nr:mechanosensitive ion channel [Rickettsiales bacterium]
MWEFTYNKIANFFSADWFNNDMSIMSIIKEIARIIKEIWNYKVFTISGNEDVMVYNIVISVVLLFIGFKISKRLSIVIRRKLSKKLDISTAYSLARVSYYIMIMLVLIFILDIANVPVTVFAVIGTTFALGFGLGAQHIVGNFFSGLLIMAENSIRIGDIIEVKDKIGEVTDLGTRCITIKTSDDIEMIIPNSSLIQEVIINHSNHSYKLRHSLSFKIESGIKIAKIDKLILDVLNNYPAIQTDPLPRVLYKSICQKYYEIEVEFYFNPAVYSKHMYITDAINRALSEVLKKYNVS